MHGVAPPRAGGGRPLYRIGPARPAKRRGSLVIVTVATSEPEATAREYLRVFRGLGIQRLEVLDIRTRDQAEKEACTQQLAEASGVFFTGGDQLRITSQIGDSAVFEKNAGALYRRRHHHRYLGGSGSHTGDHADIRARRGIQSCRRPEHGLWARPPQRRDHRLSLRAARPHGQPAWSHYPESQEPGPGHRRGYRGRRAAGR